MSKNFFIHSPSLDQAQFIIRLLNNYYPKNKKIGVIYPDEKRIQFKGLSKYIKPEDVDYSSLQGIHIPTGAKSTEFLLQKGAISLGNITLTQNAYKVYDKEWFLNFCSGIGIPIPETYSNIASVNEFPIFYKQKHEVGGGVRGIANTLNDLPKKRDNLIFQELIKSQGTYGVDFLAKDGEIIVSYQHFEVESLPKDGGSAVFIKEYDDEKLASYTQKIIRELNYSGWGLAEYKYCYKREDYILMEINTKFWASCEFAFTNQPRFLEELFYIDSKEEKVNEMIFMNRVFERGMTFTLCYLKYILEKPKVIFYKGWQYSLLKGFVPIWFKSLIKKLV